MHPPTRRTRPPLDTTAEDQPVDRSHTRPRPVIVVRGYGLDPEIDHPVSEEAVTPHQQLTRPKAKHPKVRGTRVDPINQPLARLPDTTDDELVQALTRPIEHDQQRLMQHPQRHRRWHASVRTITGLTPRTTNRKRTTTRSSPPRQASPEMLRSPTHSTARQEYRARTFRARERFVTGRPKSVRLKPTWLTVQWATV